MMLFQTAVSQHPDCPDEVKFPATRYADNGFILVPVLMILALLALVVSILVRTASLQIQASANLIEQAQVRGLADGVARIMMQDVVRGRWRAEPGAGALSCRLGGNRVDIEIVDLSGLVDINAAPQELIEALFGGIGMSAAQAVFAASAVVEFRAAETSIVSGFDPGLYRREGRSYGPKHAPFQTVDELDQVLGITPQWLDKLRPLVTVNSRSRGIDPSVASPAVVAALTRAVSASQFSNGSVPPQFVGRRSTRSYGVTVTVAGAGGGTYTRHVEFELTPTQERGYLLREWTRWNVRAASATPTGRPAAACFAD